MSSSEPYTCGQACCFLRSERRHFQTKYWRYSAQPDSSATSVCSGSSTGHTATTRCRSMPAARARAATRSEKLPPSENPARYNLRPGCMRLQAAHGADDLGDAARVENFLVQVMALAVVAQVEPRHVVARIEQRLARATSGTAIDELPSQPCSSTARRSLAARPISSCVATCASKRTPSPQSTSTSRETRRRLGRTPHDRAPAHRQARVDRLQVVMPQPPRRHEVEQAGARRSLRRDAQCLIEYVRSMAMSAAGFLARQ